MGCISRERGCATSPFVFGGRIISQVAQSLTHKSSQEGRFGEQENRLLQGESHRDEDNRKTLVHDFFTGYFTQLSRTVQGVRQYLLDAARCTHSYITAVQAALQSEVQGCTALVNIHSMDDLSKKFRCRYAHAQVVSGMRVCGRKFNGTVCTVFTNVQRVFFCMGNRAMWHMSGR